MKKKNFISTADALIYIIKRLDGTDATIGDGDDEGDDPIVIPSTKKLLIKTYAIYGYESQFIMEVPSDAPDFSNFEDVLRYLDSIGKFPTVSNEWMPSDADLENMKQYIVPIRGIFANDSYVQSFMIVHNSGAEPSEDEFHDLCVISYGLEYPEHGPYHNYKQMSTLSVFNSFDNDEVKYVDDFEISSN